MLKWLQLKIHPCSSIVKWYKILVNINCSKLQTAGILKSNSKTHSKKGLCQRLKANILQNFNLLKINNNFVATKLIQSATNLGCNGYIYFVLWWYKCQLKLKSLSEKKTFQRWFALLGGLCWTVCFVGFDNIEFLLTAYKKPFLLAKSFFFFSFLSASLSLAFFRAQRTFLWKGSMVLSPKLCT